MGCVQIIIVELLKSMATHISALFILTIYKGINMQSLKTVLFNLTSVWYILNVEPYTYIH